MGQESPQPGTLLTDAAAPDGSGEEALAARLLRLAELEQDFQGALLREKLAALRELAYGLSHEINNPLASIATRAQTLLRDEKDPERRRSLATINTQAFRAHEMIADMMLFAKPPAPVLACVDVAEVIRLALDELQLTAQEQATTLAFTGMEAGVEIQADKVQLGVALRVLMQNALEALATGGRIEVKLELGSFASQLEANALPSIAKIAPATTSPQPSAAITVSDDGPGMSDEALRHCFDPFYSGREAGRGLGLGLSKVWRIVQLHQGQISVASQPGYGTTFTLVLPMAGPGTK